MKLPEAWQIVDAASRRGLGARPRLRVLAAVLWSSYLGAVCGVLAVMIAPEGLLDPPLTLGRLGIVFAAAWLLALIPAGFVALTAGPAAPPDVPEPRGDG